MDFFLNRYRNLSVLILVVTAQFLLLVYQLKNNQDVRLIRVWAVSSVTPFARVLESMRSNTASFLNDYVFLVSARQENKRLKEELGRAKMENHFLKSELSTADRAKTLTAFMSRTQGRMLGARIIGAGTAANSKVILVDRGESSGVQRGMPVVTADGIVGKITSVFRDSSMVLLITDGSFAAGVVSQKNRVHGTLKGQGQGHTTCIVDYVQIEDKVEQGEWFYTSGDDLIFPKGLPVGMATVVRPGRTTKEIYLTPSGLQNAPEELLIILDVVHQTIPTQAPAQAGGYFIAPTPPRDDADAGGLRQPASPGTVTTDADKIRDKVFGVAAPKPAAGTASQPGGPPAAQPPAPKPRLGDQPAVRPAPGDFTPPRAQPPAVTPKPQTAPAVAKQ